MGNVILDCCVDEAGAVVNPPLHDSELFSIETGKVITKLGFKLVDDEIVYCSLIGVKQFICNGLRQGNIVLDLTLVEGKALSNRVRDKLFTPPSVHNEKFNEFLTSIDSSLESKELILVVLNPSYGCEVLAVCEKIIFESLH